MESSPEPCWPYLSHVRPYLSHVGPTFVMLARSMVMSPVDTVSPGGRMGGWEGDLICDSYTANPPRRCTQCYSPISGAHSATALVAMHIVLQPH